MNALIRQLPLVLTGVAVACGDPAPAPQPLLAGDGARVALWQAVPNPNKPYLAQLFAPGEKPLALLDDSPPDHFHHHGLMFAIGVDDTDFWAEKGFKNTGRQEPLEMQATADESGFTQRLEWRATDGAPLLEESRRVRVRSSGKGDHAVHWLDWQSTLTPATGRDAVRLSGHHYYGLGMRLLPAWSGKGRFSWQATAGQRVVRGDEKLTPSQWCAVSCEIDGRTVTLLMIDDPGNARPVRWFTMAEPFCYLSAALGLDTEPARLAAGESWKLRYGLAVMTGEVDRARLEQLAGEWRAAAAPSENNQQPSTKP